MRKALLWMSMTLIAFTLGSTYTFADSTVNWWHLQNRIYEDGRIRNRLGMGIVDSGTSQPVQSDVVSSIELYENVTTGNPTGDAITLGGHFFVTYDAVYGNYDGVTDEYSYDPLVTESYTGVNYNTPQLAAGVTYRMVVKFNDGSADFEATRTFNGLQALPEISSKNFYGYEDASGNVMWGWKAPYDTALYTGGATDTSVSAWVAMYNAGNWVGDISIKFPTQVSNMFIPQSVLSLFNADSASVGLNIRTNDNNNRWYSNEVGVDKLKKEIKKVAVVPLGN